MMQRGHVYLILFNTMKMPVILQSRLSYVTSAFRIFWKLRKYPQKIVRHFLINF